MLSPRCASCQVAARSLPESRSLCTPDMAARRYGGNGAARPSPRRWSPPECSRDACTGPASDETPALTERGGVLAVHGLQASQAQAQEGHGGEDRAWRRENCCAAARLSLDLPAKFCVMASAPKMTPDASPDASPDSPGLPMAPGPALAPAARHGPEDAVLVHQPALCGHPPRRITSPVFSTCFDQCQASRRRSWPDPGGW